MEGDILTILGLVGVTLVISVGKWLSGLREWLLGFTVRANPLRVLGEMLTCTVSVGCVVGALWALGQSASWSGVIVMGGFISLAAYVADEGLALMDAGVRKLMGAGPPPIPPQISQSMLNGSEQREKERPPRGNKPLSEEEAHAIIGGGDDDE